MMLKIKNVKNDEKSKKPSLHQNPDKLENRFKKTSDNSLDCRLANLCFKKPNKDLSKEKSFLQNKSMAHDFQLCERSILSASINVPSGLSFYRYLQ